LERKDKNHEQEKRYKKFMPEKSINKKSARKPRNRFPSRADKKKQGCTGSKRDHKSGPSIISNSLFALTLKPKIGYDVIEKVNGKKTVFESDEDPEQMYRDLLAAVTRAQKLLKIEGTTMDPLASGMEYSVSMYMVINRFKETILPKGYDFNVDRDGDSGLYYFTVYKEVDFPWAWHTFEIKNVVMMLAKKNKRLHDVFISVIGNFYKHTGIDTWWNNGLCYMEYLMYDTEEFILNHFQPETPEEEEANRKKISDMIEMYQKGDAYKYSRLIKAAKIEDPAKLMKRLSGFHKRNSVVQWLYKAIEFMMKPGCMEEYVYEELEYDEGISLCQQSSLMWDYDDYAYQYQGQCLDEESANCGVVPAYLNFPITKNNRFIDLANLPEREQWLMRFSKLHSEYNEMLNKIKKS